MQYLFVIMLSTYIGYLFGTVQQFKKDNKMIRSDLTKVATWLYNNEEGLFYHTKIWDCLLICGIHPKTVIVYNFDQYTLDEISRVTQILDAKDEQIAAKKKREILIKRRKRKR